MKYLKTINETFNTDDYYTKINSEEYKYLLLNGVKEVFNSREVNFIKNLKEYKTFVNYWIKKDKSATSDFEESVLVHLIPKSGLLSITKLEDEYFIIYFSKIENEFYKCDQFEGLVRFLKDHIIP